MIDVIVEHPRDLLFPWFMQAMKKYRDLFGRVIIVMTQTATEHDFTGYINSQIPNATIIEQFDDDGTDWRNAAIHEALKYSLGDTILFLEQDFLFTPQFIHFFCENEESKKYDVVGFYEGSRLHPAFLRIQKSTLNNTSQDFSVEKDVGDHFSKLTKEIKNTRELCLIAEIGGDEWYHLAGTSQNYRLTSNWFNPQVFYQYNHLIMSLPQHPLWKQICEQKEREMGKVSPHPTINLERFFNDLS